MQVKFANKIEIKNSVGRMQNGTHKLFRRIRANRYGRVGSVYDVIETKTKIVLLTESYGDLARAKAEQKAVNHAATEIIKKRLADAKAAGDLTMMALMEYAIKKENEICRKFNQEEGEY